MTDHQPLKAQRRLFGNTALLSASELLVQLMNFAFVVCLARVFGRELLGMYAFAMAIGALLSVLVSLGTHMLVLRKLSRAPEQTLDAVGALLLFQTVLALTLILAAHLGARWLGADPLMVWVITLVIAYHVLTRVTQLLMLGYSARQEMLPSAVTPLVRRGTVLLLGGLAMFGGGGALLALASMPVAALLMLFLVTGFAVRRFGRPRLRWQWAEIGTYLRQGLPFFYIVALTTLYTRLGIVYLTVLGGEAEAGLFASAERVVVAAGMIQLMFYTALFPVVSRLWHHQPEHFAELVQRAGRLTLFLTLPMATLLTLFAGDIVRIVYGHAFSEAAQVLAVVAWVLVVRGVAQLLSTTSQASDHQRLLVSSRLLGLILLTLASLVFVPAHGALGLVVAMLMSELGAAALNYALLRRAGVAVMRFAGGWRVLLACLVAAGLAWALADLDWWLRALLVAGGGALALWIFGAIRNHDLAYLRAIVWPRNAR